MDVSASEQPNNSVAIPNIATRRSTFGFIAYTSQNVFFEVVLLQVFGSPKSQEQAELRKNVEMLDFAGDRTRLMSSLLD